MIAGMPSCWICGATADSAEHMMKASDVRAMFPTLKQHAPAYRHSKVQINEPIRGAQATLLKFKPSICQHCNNARSQPWDRAWEVLEKGVRQAKPRLSTGKRIPLSRIFPTDRREAMLNVHSYLTKQLGCIAVEHNIPLPIGSFAANLLGNTAEPNLRIVFVHISHAKTKIQSGYVNATKDNMTGEINTAVWHYIVGTLGVAVSYVKPGYSSLRLTTNEGWHPTDASCTWMLR